MSSQENIRSIGTPQSTLKPKLDNGEPLKWQHNSSPKTGESRKLRRGGDNPNQSAMSRLNQDTNSLQRPKETVKVLVAANEMSITQSYTTYDNRTGNSPHSPREGGHTDLLVMVNKKSRQEELGPDTALQSKPEENLNSDLKSRSPGARKNSSNLRTATRPKA